MTAHLGFALAFCCLSIIAFAWRMRHHHPSKRDFILLAIGLVAIVLVSGNYTLFAHFTF